MGRHLLGSIFGCLYHRTENGYALHQTKGVAHPVVSKIIQATNMSGRAAAIRLQIIVLYHFAVLVRGDIGGPMALTTNAVVICFLLVTAFTVSVVSVLPPG